MEGFSGPGVEAMWDGAPTDLNIREDFPVEARRSTSAGRSTRRSDPMAWPRIARDRIHPPRPCEGRAGP